MIETRVRELVPSALLDRLEVAIADGSGPGLRRKRWTLVNHKGGVGKTFDTLALAWVLAVCYGLHVLVVDMDPQANSTRRAGYGAHATENLATLTEALKLNEVGNAKMIVKPFKWEIPNGSIDILPSRLDLEARSEEAAVAGAVYRIRSAVKQSRHDLLDQLNPIMDEVVGSLTHPRERLRNILGGGFVDDYDIVLIDCQPSLGHLTQNAYVASDGVLLCTKADYDSLNGAVRTQTKLHETRKALGVPELDVHGVLLTDLQIINRTRGHGSFRAAEESIGDLQEAFGGLLWTPFLERKSALAENTDYGVPIVENLTTKDREHVTTVMIEWGAKLLEVSLG